MSFLGKLNGIVHDIDEYLFNPAGIPMIHAGKRIIVIPEKGKSAARSCNIHHVHNFRDNVPDIIVICHKLHLTRFYF